MPYTMIRRIWLSSGIRRLMLGCTLAEMRWALEGCEGHLNMRNYTRKDKEERVELEDFRRILISEIQRRQVEAMAADRKREARTRRMAQ